MGIPIHLLPIADEIIRALNNGTVLSENAESLVRWYDNPESDGWDELLKGLEDFVINLGSLAEYKFTDSEVKETLGLKGKISDEMRVSFAKNELKKVIDNLSDWDCPGVYAVQLSDKSGKQVTLGWLLEGHGPHGDVVNFQGAFLS